MNDLLHTFESVFFIAIVTSMSQRYVLPVPSTAKCSNSHPTKNKCSNINHISHEAFRSVSHCPSTFRIVQPLMKLRTNPPILHAIHPKLKHQPRTLNPHIQRKIQIIKLHTLTRRQPRKQALRHRIQVRRKRAHRNQPLPIAIRRDLGIACDEVVFHDERLPRAEVARVVE